MRHLIGLFTLGLLAGCSYTGLMKPWIGESADSLVARWGASASTTALPDGGAVIEYHDSVRPGFSGYSGPGPLGFASPPSSGSMIHSAGGYPGSAGSMLSESHSFIAQSQEFSARAAADARASMDAAVNSAEYARESRLRESFHPGGFVPSKGKLPCTTRFTTDASHTITKVVAEGGGCNQGWYLETMYFTKHRVKKAPPKASPVTPVPEAAQTPAGPSG